MVLIYKIRHTASQTRFIGIATNRGLLGERIHLLLQPGKGLSWRLQELYRQDPEIGIEILKEFPTYEHASLFLRRRDLDQRAVFAKSFNSTECLLTNWHEYLLPFLPTHSA